MFYSPLLRRAGQSGQQTDECQVGLLANEEKTRIYLINPDTKKEIPQTEWTSELKQNLENATGFKHLVFDGMNSTIILVKFKEFDAQKGVMEQVMGRQLDERERMAEK